MLTGEEASLAGKRESYLLKQCFFIKKNPIQMVLRSEPNEQHEAVWDSPEKQ